MNHDDRAVSSSRVDREVAYHDRRFGDSDGTRRAGRFYDLTTTSHDHFAALIARIAAPARVLELGCGPDSVAWALIDRGIDVVGIDISDEAIHLARTKARERGVDPSSFVTMNAQNLTFEAASFDAVIGSSILHHLDLHPALGSIRRVLRRGGRAIFYEPSGRNPLINLYRRATPDQRSPDERPLTGADLDLLRATFDMVRLDSFHLTSLAALALLRTRYFDRAASLLESFDRSLMRRIPRLQLYAWVVVIEAMVDSGPETDPGA